MIVNTTFPMAVEGPSTVESIFRLTMTMEWSSSHGHLRHISSSQA